MGSDGLSPLREVIARHGLSPRRALGQNYLLDLNLTTKIAQAAGPLDTHDILEIGPGPGGLTRSLLNAGARRVVAVEKDARFLPALAEIATAYPGRLSVLQEDALGLNLSAHTRAPVRICANLPYNVATAILVELLSPPHWPPRWDTLTLMFQREVAERIVAPVGTKAYGRLSLLTQWRTDARTVFHLPPEAFFPAPKVRSSVVHFTALPRPRFAADATVLLSLIAKGFNQRRKMLRTSLKGISPRIEDLLISCAIEPTSRAEQVELAQWCALAQALVRE